MDNHYSSNYNPPYPSGNPPQHQSLGSFGSLSAQLNQQDSPSHATLPPLQSQNGGYPFGSMSFASQHPGSQAQTPTTPHTPVSSSSMNGANNNPYPHMPSANAQPGAMLPPSSYHQPYPSQSMPYPSSSATSMPPTSASQALPQIRPMPPGGFGAGMNGLPSLSTGGQLGQQASFLQNEEAPTHVVGSQGRRGILPSAPGRPNPPAQGTAQSAKSMIPQKDVDGKFPCPHCNKTYLHAKHLKRHLLRRKNYSCDDHEHDANKSQTLAIDHTCVIFARIHFPAVTSSSDISRSARYGAAIRQEPTTLRISAGTRMAQTDCL